MLRKNKKFHAIVPAQGKGEVILMMITTIHYAEDVLCLKVYSYQALGRAKDLGHTLSMKP